MRLFRENLHMTIWDYLCRPRVTHAQWLLIDSDMTISEIAFDAGFGASAPFYQDFHRYAPGVKPNQYRKTMGLANRAAGAK
jgi:transcriptional regulator GlxA family with amidase domain